MIIYKPALLKIFSCYKRKYSAFQVLFVSLHFHAISFNINYQFRFILKLMLQCTAQTATSAHARPAFFSSVHLRGSQFLHQCTGAGWNFCTMQCTRAACNFFISAQKRLTIFSPVLLLYEVCNVYIFAHARTAIFHQCTYADSNFSTSAHARPAVFSTSAIHTRPAVFSTRAHARPAVFCTSAIHTRPAVFSTSAHTRPAVFFTSANERPAILAPVHLQGLQVREMYFLHQCTFYCGTPVNFAL